MNRKILTAAVGIFALGVVVTPAAAQMSKPVGLSIRAGVVWPTDSATRNSVGNTLFGAGLEFKVMDMQGMGMPGTNAHLSISGDWFGKNSGYVIPVLLNFVGTQNEFYYSAGAGASFVHGGSGSSNNTNFGYQVGLGYNFSTGAVPVFVEAHYWGCSKSQFNAIGAYLGVRL